MDLNRSYEFERRQEETDSRTGEETVESYIDKRGGDVGLGLQQPMRTDARRTPG